MVAERVRLYLSQRSTKYSKVYFLFLNCGLFSPTNVLDCLDGDWLIVGTPGSCRPTAYHGVVQLDDNQPRLLMAGSFNGTDQFNSTFEADLLPVS